MCDLYGPSPSLPISDSPTCPYGFFPYGLPEFAFVTWLVQSAHVYYVSVVNRGPCSIAPSEASTCGQSRSQMGWEMPKTHAGVVRHEALDLGSMADQDLFTAAGSQATKAGARMEV